MENEIHQEELDRLLNVEHPVSVKILFNDKPLLFTAIKSVPDSPEKIAKFLREMADVFDSPEKEDKDFF